VSVGFDNRDTPPPPPPGVSLHLFHQHATPHLQDVAIAYGYNNMPRQIPATSTFGRELPLMQLTESLRSEIKDYTESLTWALCSRAENFGHLNRHDDGLSAVSIGNPATAEFEVCRTTLLPGTACIPVNILRGLI